MNEDLLARYWGGRSSQPLAVAATSCWNGLASNPYHLWAFRRADLTAFTHTPFRNIEGNPVVMGQVRQLDPRTFGAERMEALLRLGLRDLLPSLARLPHESGPIAVFLGLSERFGHAISAGERRTKVRLEMALSEALAGVGCEHFLHIETRGHASGVVGALQAADAVLTGMVPAAVVGGIDSSYDPEVVETLLEQDRLLDAGHLDAMVPGEGAAFVLLTQPSLARMCGLPRLAQLEGAAVNSEPATFDNDVGLLGLGLSRAASAVGRELKREGRRLDWWLTDLTPEHWRVQEFQLAWPRAARGLMEPTSSLEHLPHHLGDLGAATIPTGVALVAEAFGRGDPPARSCLLTASSDGGTRGVLLLGASQGHR